MKRLKRTYNIADPYMIEFAMDIRNSFLTDQAAFVAIDADFGGTFADDWQAAIEATFGLASNETVLDELQILTAKVEEAMKACRQKYQFTKFFIEKAFPEQPLLWRKFGFEDYNAIRAKPPLLIEFMTNLFVVTTAHQAELGAVGYGAAAIAEIVTLKEALETANQVQKEYNRSRGLLTHNRVLAYNAVWSIVQKVARMGKLIFAENFAKYNLYLLPTTEERRDLLTLTGRIADASTDAPITQAEATIEELNISTESDSNGLYGFGQLPGGTYTLRVEKVGYVTVRVPDLVLVEGQVLERDVGLEEVRPTPL